MSNRYITNLKVILSEAKNPVFMRILDSSLHFVPFRMTLLKQPFLNNKNND
ncbi:MAG: hypothetical protein ABSG15_05295 [FCB group bacterium]